MFELTVVVGSQDSARLEQLRERCQAEFADHSLIIDPSSLRRFANGRRSNERVRLPRLHRGQRFDEVTIVAENGKASWLTLILEALSASLAEELDLKIAGFGVTGAQFRWLAERCNNLEFFNCQFGRGWWTKPKTPRRCTFLRMDSCYGAVPLKVRTGQAAWDQLQSLWVYGLQPLESLMRSKWKRVPCELTASNQGQFAEKCVTALWGTRLDSIVVNDFSSVDFLTALPTRATLSSVMLRSAVSIDVFMWLVTNENVRDLDLVWERGTQLPWGQLRRLKRLTFLDATGSFLNDDQLFEIANATKLRRLHIYYTDLTPKCWTTIPTWKSLRSVWVSQEMAFTEEPLDLPESTPLKECVALNARTERFRGFLSRYPKVKVVEM